MIESQATEPLAGAMSADAPRIRIIAGLGSAAQKTWNVRRPVTLIGSRRPAHIVLHDPGISEAHCVLVNTGREVLLKDLHTKGGTFCRNTRVDITVVKDGDVVRVGNTTIQIAIKYVEGAVRTVSEPTRLTVPTKVGLVHTEQAWPLEDAVTLVGRHPNAPIRLDHDDVRRRHAVFFRFGSELAVFELGKDESVRVNGVASPFAILAQGDRVSIGPFGLRVGGSAVPSPTDGANTPAAGNGKRNGTSGELEVDLGLDVIRAQIAESWGKLNRWHDESVQILPPADLAASEPSGEDPDAVEAAEAALRGQLHDVSVYQERLAAKEQELSGRATELRLAASENSSRAAELVRKEAELSKRADELARREHVLAQRRAKLHAAVCPHCGGRQSGSDLPAAT